MQSRVLAILIAVVLALVATTAMIVYVNGADRRAIKDQEPTKVLVAQRPIPTGLTSEEAQNGKYVKEITVPAKSALKGRVLSWSQLRNRVAAVDIVVGEQLLLERWVGAEDIGGRRLLSIREGHQAVSVGVDLVRQVAGFVTPGDHVNVAVTRPDPNKEGEDKTDFVLQDVQVLAVGSTALTRAPQGSAGRVNQGKGSQNLIAVTLSVENQFVIPVINAAEEGSIYLTLLPPKTADAAGGGTAGDAGDVPGGP
jgi:pilus assembly protein CpaB